MKTKEIAQEFDRQNAKIQALEARLKQAEEIIVETVARLQTRKQGRTIATGDAALCLKAQSFLSEEK